MSSKEHKAQKSATEPSAQSLAFKYHREVHTRELKDFIFSAYGLNSTPDTERKSDVEKISKKNERL